MRRWGWLGLFLLAAVLLAGPVRAQTTTTVTTTTTTTLATALPTNDGRYFTTAVDLTLPSAKGEIIVYADTRSGDVTITMPATGCGCKVAIAKLYDDHLLHIGVADAGTEGLAPPPFIRVTSFDLDKASSPVVFVSNPPSKTWFLGY